MCVAYTYIYIHRSYIGGWGGESNWEIVSFRSCVRAQLYVRSEWISKVISRPFSLFLIKNILKDEIKLRLHKNIKKYTSLREELEKVIEKNEKLNQKSLFLAETQNLRERIDLKLNQKDEFKFSLINTPCSESVVNSCFTLSCFCSFSTSCNLFSGNMLALKSVRLSFEATACAVS